MMGMFKAALFALAVFGVDGAPFNGRWPMRYSQDSRRSADMVYRAQGATEQ
jgi:hypothetical protein